MKKTSAWKPQVRYGKDRYGYEGFIAKAVSPDGKFETNSCLSGHKTAFSAKRCAKRKARRRTKEDRKMAKIEQKNYNTWTDV